MHREGGFTPADSRPVWSPDGKQLTVVRYVATSPYSVNTFTIATGKLTKIGAGSVPIGWYSDGTITTIGGGNNTFSAIDTVTGDERTLLTFPKPLMIDSIDPKP